MDDNTKKYPREVEITVWHDGDRSVGISGDQAIVSMSVYDLDHEHLVREVLSDAFGQIWDRSRIQVQIDDAGVIGGEEDA